MSVRRLAAVMVTDMVGFTAFMDEDQDYALDLLARSHEVLRSTVARHSGEWLEHPSDRSLTAFPSAITAVECAMDIQAQLKGERHLELRIGIDIGDIVISDGHVYGEAVNVASLIERLADPGGLVITEGVFEAVRSHIPDLHVIDLGEKVLKNVRHGIRLYALTGAPRRSRLAGMFSALMARRVPHITGAYLAAIWAVVEVSDWLAGNDLFDHRWVYVISVALLALVPTVLLIAYSHGAHGRERLTNAEKFGVPLNVVLAVSLAAFVYQNADTPERTTPIRRASVAVLPFVNLGTEERDAYFGLGLSEELINALAKVPGLYVASRTSSFIFEGRNEDPRDIARKLRVATILEGSMRKQGGKVRITAQLIDGEDNYNLWTGTFDRELVDILQIQEEIARSVATELVGVLKPGVVSAISEARAATLEAYDFYLQGLSYLRQPATNESLDGARRLLERALEEDPDYAQAHAALCELALERFVLDRAASLIEEAKTACFRALRLDQSSREVRFALADLYRHTGDFEESARILRELLERQPTAQAWLGLGETRAAQGSLAEAETAFGNAIAMEPGNWRNRMALAEFLYLHGRFEESLEAWQRVIELSPGNARAYLLMAASYDYLGDTEASIRANLKSIELEPTRAGYRDLGLTYYSTGDYERAAAAFERAAELGGDDYATWGDLATTYRRLGREAEATAAFERAIQLATALLQVNPRDWTTMAKAGVYYAMIGEADEARQRTTTAVAGGAHIPDVHFYDAVVHMLLGQDELALDALERGLELGAPARMISTDPFFEGLKGNRRFREMLQDKLEE